MIYKLFEDNPSSPRKNIKLNGVSSPKQYGGVAYICIPDGVERNNFVETCYRTSTVSIQTEDGQVYNRVPIDKNSINFIEFPTENRTLGSPVVWLNMPYHDQPVVVGVYNALDEFTKLEEYQFNLERITDQGCVKISGKGKTGELFISVNQYNNNSSSSGDLQEDEVAQDSQQVEGGKIYIDIQNDTGTAELNVNVNGSVNLVTTNKTYVKNAKELEFEVRDEVSDPDNGLSGISTKLIVTNGQITFKIVSLDEDNNETIETSFSYIKGTGLNFTDEFGNKVITSSNQVQVSGAKQVLGEGSEPMVLGTTLQEQIAKEKLRVDSIIQAFKSSSVTAEDGGATFKAGLIAATESLEAPDYSAILSQKSSTD